MHTVLQREREREKKKEEKSQGQSQGQSQGREEERRKKNKKKKKKINIHLRIVLTVGKCRRAPGIAAPGSNAAAAGLCVHGCHWHREQEQERYGEQEKHILIFERVD